MNIDIGKVIDLMGLVTLLSFTIVIISFALLAQGAYILLRAK